MEITPDPSKLLSGKLSRDALHAVFGTALLTAASVDCENVVDPESRRAGFGKALAANLAIFRLVNPDMAWLYEIVLADYIRFCKLYVEGSLPKHRSLGLQVRKTIAQTLRTAYKERKKELFNVQNIVSAMDAGE